MFSNTKLLAAFAAVVISITAFASAGEARTYYRGWGWQVAPVGYVSYQVAPVGYVSYVIDTRNHLRVCYWASEYTKWGAYVGLTYVCTPV
jgi:hypothetical protein